MYSFARKSLVWLVAAVYFLDGVLVGAAHFHGHSHEDSAARGPAVVQATTHSHAHCGHSHHHHDLAPTTKPDREIPSAPHEHEDCAACRYSSLAAEPVSLPVVPEFEQSVELEAGRLPLCPATKYVSLHPARAPPAAA